MPPRWVAIGIVLFWLAATGWLVQSELWPQWFPPPDVPPPYDIDMIDEFGTGASWYVFVDGEDAGMGSSEVKINKEDGSLNFQTKLHFQRKPLMGFCSSIETVNHITNQGQLLDFSILVKVKYGKTEQIEEIGIRSKIDKGLIRSRGTFSGRSMDLPSLEVPENGIVFNPAALGTRIRRIYKGQTWHVPSLDVKALILRQSLSVLRDVRYAEVDEEVIRWGDEDVICYRIDLRKGGKPVEASTWVRKRDGQVLKQRAMYDDVEVRLVRQPEHRKGPHSE